MTISSDIRFRLGFYAHIFDVQSSTNALEIFGDTSSLAVTTLYSKGIIVTAKLDTLPSLWLIIFLFFNLVMSGSAERKRVLYKPRGSGWLPTQSTIVTFWPS